MQTIALPLAAADGGSCRVTLRELRGDDELALEGVGTRAAVRLIDRLIEPTDPAAPPADAMCASDRDRLLTALYQRIYGDTISATPLCIGCGARFDVSFSLSDLQRHLDAQRMAARPEPGGVIALANGAVQPLPSGRDEVSAGDLSWDEGIALLRAAAGDAPADRLEAIAPLLDLEVEARCPECDAAQLAGFDIQSFLLASLLNERTTLVQEIHLLASSYGWRLSDILTLSRADRRALVATIDDERSRTAQAARGALR